MTDLYPLTIKIEPTSDGHTYSITGDKWPTKFVRTYGVSELDKTPPPKTEAAAKAQALAYNKYFQLELLAIKNGDAEQRFLPKEGVKMQLFESVPKDKSDKADLNTVANAQGF
mgnify:FL=1